MKIINLKAENIKKIKAVDITPKDNTVVITGKNGQGKSSILDSILYALGGKNALKKTPKPIREGEEKASVVLDLGDYVVTRTWNQSGTTRLEVKNADGAKYGSPQEMLDELVGAISFDPLEFGNMKPAEQKQVLLDVLGLTEQVEKLQDEYNEIYEERREVGRDLKKTEGYMLSISVPEDAPKSAVDTADVAKKLREAEINNDRMTVLQGNIDRGEEVVADLEKRLVEAKGLLKKDKAYLKGMEHQPTEELQRQLENSTELNTKYQLVEDKRKAEAEYKALEGQQKELTNKLSTISDNKEKLISEAKLPIKGLSIDIDGVTFDGIPFTQLSSAEQLKVSLAIAMATNPELRVIRIMDGSLLDSENMKVINQMAKDEDYQIWVERVEDSGKVGILIEDGEVKN